MDGRSESDREPPKVQSRRPARLRKIPDLEPDFIGKVELAHHLQCHINTIDGWIEEGRIPPPHSWPGERHPIWLRRYYNVYRDTGEWPKDAWKSGNVLLDARELTSSRPVSPIVPKHEASG
jgi:hypothetical protein